MMSFPNLRHRLAQSFGIAAAAVLMMSATQRAEALSPVNPAASPIAKIASDPLITEAHGGHGGGGGGFHGGGGGGGGFHGGGFHGGPAFHGGGGGYHGGGAVFHGAGGFHGAGSVFHGGGLHHHGGGHFIFARHHHHHHFGPGFYGYGYEDYPTYYDYPRRCRIVWTHYGRRRICGYHRWHHHRYHYWHHHRRHHHRRVY